MSSVTGIPVELLFAALGVLILGIGSWIIKELRSLRKESVKRSVQIVILTLNVRRVFDHLKLTYFNTGENGNGT